MASQFCILLPLLLAQIGLGQWLPPAVGGMQLKKVAQWSAVDFSFPSPKDRDEAIASGRYTPENCIPLDMDVDYGNAAKSRLFVTIPRFQTGIPYTLGRVSGNQGPSGPLVEPYPNAAIQDRPESKNCNGIVSVFRIKIDECNRMWVLDTGRVGETRMCPPKLIVFDMKTDKIIHRYEIPADQLVCDLSLLVNLLVDVQDPSPLGSCQDTKVYLADVTAPGMIVYDMARRKSWRITNKQMHPNPDYGTFTIAGESFDLMDGIVAMAMSPRIPTDNVVFSAYGRSWRPVSDRLVYFHALASMTENVVRTSVLNNDTVWEDNVEAEQRAFRPIGNRYSQSVAEAMDSNGNLIFGLVAQNAIACWDSTTPYTPANMRILSQNSETLQFPSGLKVVRNRKGVEELWVLSCRFQKVMTGSLNTNETNFRIQAIQMPEILGRKTSCKL
ncbi:protein yellow-like [Anopheles cruzii]|uniref:protein yellow-like n=1 Tax=Anopheles cruzii TaxID=68878 RepID=UPI0022EC28BA|nr:protein yellow-like [Anopheles cruzii]XP_052868861.1 protein yellow-like [Anopheles cruzii]XP_052868862.1 protein yellow-like [Anopheles cruzii]